MSQMLKSAGVDTVEVDQSFIDAGAPAAGAILIGRTPRGPAYYPVTVRNWDQYVATFGYDPNMQVSYAAKNYLKNASSLTVIRTLGHADQTTTTNGYSVTSIVGIADTSGSVGVTGSILAVLHTNVSPAAVQVSGVALDANRFTIRLGSTFAATASFLTSSDDYIGKVLNTDPTKYSTYGHYLHQTFPYEKQAVSASWYPVRQGQVSSTFQRSYSRGTTSWVKSQLLGGQEYDLLRFHTFGAGRATNGDIKVTIANVRPSVAPTANPYGMFDVIVRAFNDTDQRPIVLERFSNLTLDPTSQSYVLRQIGDRIEEFNTNTRKFAIVQGNYPNRSRHIIVELNTAASPPPQALPWGFRGYAREIFSGSHLGNGNGFGLALIPDLPYTPNQINSAGAYDSGICWGVSFVSGGIVDRMRALPDSVTLTGSDADFSLKNLSGTIVNGAIRYSYNTQTPVAYTPVYASSSLQSFTLPFAGGFDGFDLRVQDPLYLQNSAGDTDIGVVSLKRAVDCVSNPDQVVANAIAIPGVHNIAVTDYTRAMVNKRKDMFYVMDITGSTVSEAVSSLNAREIDDNYAGTYYPDVIVDDTTPGVNRMVRLAPSTVVMGALAYTDKFAQAFFAPAGLNRGGLSQFDVKDIVDRLEHEDRDQLSENRINPITKFPDEGIVIFGQKTLQMKPSALDRINVRRLLILAKRAIANEARSLVFEPNIASTWTKFKNRVNPILEKYRSDQGISRFKVVMDETTTTPAMVDSNQMRGKIFLEPVRAAEYITIDFVITNTGVQFGS